jgi:hypothetical protein
MLLARSDDGGVRAFFNAVNLEDGEQVALSAAGMHAVSKPRDMDLLRDERHYAGQRLEDNPLLAEAIAASSAFPPVFKPIRIRVRQEDGRRRRVHLLDGAVTDNAGFKLFVSLYFSFRRRANRNGASVRRRVLDDIDVVVTCDAGKVVSPKSSVWTRMGGVMRLLGIAQNAQAYDLFGDIEVLKALNLRPLLFGLQVGIPDFYTDDAVRQDIELDEINSPLGKIRTHLDAFSIPEIVALAYCGYRQIDNFVGVDELPALGNGIDQPQYASLSAYARGFGWDVSEKDVLEALRRSTRRVSIRRTLSIARERFTYPI